MDNTETCPICERELPDDKTVDRHHLIPKSKNGRYTDTIKIHKICHSKIHSLWSEAELFGYYHTPDRIRSHGEMKKFIKWVKKKPIDYYDKSKRSNRRK